MTVGQTKDGLRITALVLARQADLPALKSSIASMREQLRPADPKEIAATLARLFSHYPSQASGNNMTVAQDWIEDMSGVSATAFREAVRQWRQGAHAFKPSPGQLLSIIAEVEAPARTRLDSLEEIEAETERMTPAERLNHLHQWLYQLELGLVPYEIHQKGAEAIQRYLASETELVKSEIAQLETMGA